MTDDEEDEDERTQQRNSPILPGRPVAATFQGKRLEPVPLVRADPSAMARMKAGLEIRTPELELEPRTLPKPGTSSEDPTISVIVVPQDDEDTITKREALSDADIITTPNALSEPDSITPQASVNMLELLKRVGRPTAGDPVETAPRPPQHTLPLVEEPPDHTLPIPKENKPVQDKTEIIPKETKLIMQEALRRSKEPPPSVAAPIAPIAPPPVVIAKPKRRRWPIVLLLLLLVGGGVAYWQSPIARMKVNETIAKIRR